MHNVPMIVVGLGNPGPEFERTRHNAGRMLVEHIHVLHEFPDWHHDTKLQALVSKGTIGKELVTLILPETFMNKSGAPLKKIVTSKKAATRVVVAYDDLDLPLGALKISFNRSSGGHRGLESVIRTLGTPEFPRIRIGVSPALASGRAKKPVGEERVVKFILGKFTPAQETVFKKALKKAAAAVATIATDGYQAAMNQYN